MKAKPSRAQAVLDALAALGPEAETVAVLEWIAANRPGLKVKPTYAPVLVSTARKRFRESAAPAPAVNAGLEDAIAVKDLIAVRDLKARLGAARIRSILDLLEG